MSWDELIKHNYLNYNFEIEAKNDDLMLSYDETTGIFSATDDP